MCTARFNPKTISERELLGELKKLTKTLGRVPSRSDMANGTSLTKKLYLYDRRFGGLTVACKRAGLIPNKGGKYAKYSEKELLCYLLELKQILGRTPTQKDIDGGGRYASGAYKRHFGTYNKALDKLNIRHNVKFGISEQEIIDDIITVSKKLMRSPSTKEFTRLSGTVSSAMAIKKLNCGSSWNGVIKKCGLKILNNRNITDFELKEEIERLRGQINRIPGYYDMVQLGCYSPETYAYKFGSYLKALKRLGYNNYIPNNQWHNQTYTRGNDGALYKSKFEANIANCLLDLMVASKISYYEYEKQVFSGRQWTCDFFIIQGGEEIWLEADGMGKNRNNPYGSENEKINFYNNNNYTYIIIKYKRTGLNRHVCDLLLNRSYINIGEYTL